MKMGFGIWEMGFGKRVGIWEFGCMPQETKSKFEPGTSGAGTGAPAAENTTLQGWNVDLADEKTTLDALEKAFDFRGDVTLQLAAGGTPITGYIFDRKRGVRLGDSYVRLMTATSDDKVKIAFSDIRRVEFGRDTAQGKSFETWMKKYVEKKLKGEKAGIEAEVLE